MSLMLLHTETRLALVTHWLEWIGVAHGIYNVDNSHQCFNERPCAITRPFKEVSNFYGCMKCGKYHFCYLNQATCDIVAPTMDINNDRPTCAYSGQTVFCVHNETIGNHDRITSVRSDMRNNITLIASPEVYNTSSFYGSSTATTRRINGLESMTLSNSVRKKQTLSKKEKRLIDKQDMNQHFFNRFHTSLAPITSTPVPVVTEETENMEEDCVNEEFEIEMASCEEIEEGSSHTNEGTSDNEIDIEEKEASSNPSTIGGVIKQNRRREKELELECEEDKDFHLFENEEDDDQEDEDGELGDPFGGGGDDIPTRMKNLHDNVAFWDSYYSFLIESKPLVLFNEISGPGASNQLTLTDEESSSAMTVYTPLNQECTEEETHCIEKKTYLYEKRPKEIFKVDPQRWNTEISIIIEEETRRIIDIILRTSMRLYQKVLDNKTYTPLLERLTSYYHNIICNIVILVYHSPYMNKLALVKHEKHEKQGKSSHSAKMTVTVTDISSILNSTEDREEENPIHYQNPCTLVDPKKICASLMFHLFTDKFFLSDSMTNNISIWSSDLWLSQMKKNVFDEIIMDYNIIVDPVNPDKKHYNTAEQCANIFFKRDITSVASTIRAALATYSHHPMWLSSMIYSFKR